MPVSGAKKIGWSWPYTMRMTNLRAAAPAAITSVRNRRSETSPALRTSCTVTNIRVDDPRTSGTTTAGSDTNAEPKTSAESPTAASTTTAGPCLPKTPPDRGWQADHPSHAWEAEVVPGRMRRGVYRRALGRGRVLKAMDLGVLVPLCPGDRGGPGCGQPPRHTPLVQSQSRVQPTASPPTPHAPSPPLLRPPTSPGNRGLGGAHLLPNMQPPPKSGQEAFFSQALRFSRTPRFQGNRIFNEATPTPPKPIPGYFEP